MKLSIIIAGRGFSVNAAYGRNHALTAAARRWKLQFHKQMIMRQDDCALFSRSFNPFEHCVKVTITNRMINLLTKDGRISHASVDVDNLNKLTLDGVFSFLPGIDDCAITSLISSKIRAKDDSIAVDLEILTQDRDSLQP